MEQNRRFGNRIGNRDFLSLQAKESKANFALYRTVVKMDF